MIGLGTLINGGAIVAGGLLGNFTGKLFQQDQQESLNKACGISVIFIAIAGAMQGMLAIDGGARRVYALELVTAVPTAYLKGR